MKPSLHNIKTRLAPLFLLTCLMILPATALAADYGISYTFRYWPSFLVFVALLVYLVRKPFLKFWETRLELIDNRVKAGELALKEAEAKLEQARTLYASIDQEIKSVKESIAIEGEREAQTLIEEAKQRSERIQEQAKGTLEIEKRGMREAARLELSELALQRAREKLEQALSPELDHSLRKRAFGNIGKLVDQGGMQ